MDEITIAMFDTKVLYYFPLLLAEKLGYYGKAGLKVNFISAGGDNEAYRAIKAGKADMCVCDPMMAAVEGEEGEAKVIAEIASTFAFRGITFNQDIPEITDPAQLKDYTVATFPKGSTAYAGQAAMFRQAGLMPRIYEAPFGTVLAALKNGKADIALLMEPEATQAVQEGAKVVYDFSKLYPEFSLSGLIASQKFLDSRPEVAQALVSAIQRAVDYAKQNPEKTVELIAHEYA